VTSRVSSTSISVSQEGACGVRFSPLCATHAAHMVQALHPVIHPRLNGCCTTPPSGGAALSRWSATPRMRRHIRTLVVELRLGERQGEQAGARTLMSAFAAAMPGLVSAW